MPTFPKLQEAYYTSSFGFKYVQPAKETETKSARGSIIKRHPKVISPRLLSLDWVGSRHAVQLVVLAAVVISQPAK